VIRRDGRTADIPPELLAYRPADWPSAGAWWQARHAWLAEHRPASLDELNGWYGPGVVFAPTPDPRQVPDA
jgi:hypothetical protein